MLPAILTFFKNFLMIEYSYNLLGVVEIMTATRMFYQVCCVCQSRNDYDWYRLMVNGSMPRLDPESDWESFHQVRS